MPVLLTFVLVCLGTYRITRFITRDCLPIIAVPRDWLITYCDPTIVDVETKGIKKKGTFLRSIGYFFQCEWCMSIWVSAGVVYGTMQFTTVPLPVLWWLAASAITALIADRFEEEYDGCHIQPNEE